MQCSALRLSLSIINLLMLKLIDLHIMHLVAQLERRVEVVLDMSSSNSLFMPWTLGSGRQHGLLMSISTCSVAPVPRRHGGNQKACLWIPSSLFFKYFWFRGQELTIDTQ